MKKHTSKNWLGNNISLPKIQPRYGISGPSRNELIKRALMQQKLENKKTVIIPEKPNNIEKIENNEKNNISLNLNYKIRYAVIKSENIINLCGPDYLYIPKNNSEEELIKVKTFKNNFIKFMDEKINFFNNLEKSILDNGVLNPILITTGYPQWFDFKNLKPEHKSIKQKDFICCEILGGSRLYIAQKFKMLIPAIISDFEDVFTDAIELFNEDDISKCFENPPNTIKITEKGIRMSTLEQIHLEEKFKDYNNILELRRTFIHGY